MVFGDKEFGKHVGYPTPTDIPIDSTCLNLAIPASAAWWGVYIGLILSLTDDDAWQQMEGGISRDDAAAQAQVIYEQAIALAETDQCTDIIDAPFWDDTSGDDADDEATMETQTWYGAWDGETFTETLAYAFLTNFLSTLVGTGAAIKFLTIPRAFRVAVRQNPHGANLLLFLDGGLYKLINGYSPVDKVVEFLIASPGTELMLVVDSTHDPDSTPNGDGKYVVDVIRKRLAADEVTPATVRYYGDPPAYQTTTDGGATWVSQPTADPRYSPTSFFPPLSTYTGIECDTAARMTAALHDAITLMCNVADAAQAVTGLLELILLPSGLVGWLLDLFFTICNWIIDNGQATILAAFTDAVYHSIECQLYCRISPDGSITQAALDTAWEKIKTDHPGTVATTIDEIRFLFTDAIFSNAGVMRTETGDCIDCECGCTGENFTEDYKAAPGSAEIVAWANPPGGNAYNIVSVVPQAWVSTEGYKAGSAMTTGRYGVAIRIAFDCFQSHQIQIEFENQSGTDIQTQIGVYKQDDLSTALYSYVSGGGSAGVPYDITVNPTEFVDGVTSVYLYVGIQAAGNFNNTIRVVSSEVP